MKPIVVDFGVTDDIIGQVKVIFLTIWRIWFSRALRPCKMKISQYNYMDRVWDTSKYDPMLSVSIFNVKVTRSGEGQIKNVCLGRVIGTCF